MTTLEQFAACLANEPGVDERFKQIMGGSGAGSSSASTAVGRAERDRAKAADQLEDSAASSSPVRPLPQYEWRISGTLDGQFWWGNYTETCAQAAVEAFLVDYSDHADVSSEFDISGKIVRRV